MVQRQIDRMLLRVSHPSAVPRFPSVEEADAGWSTLAHVRPLFLSSAPTANPSKTKRTSVRGEKTSVSLRERRRGTDVRGILGLLGLHATRCETYAHV